MGLLSSITSMFSGGDDGGGMLGNAFGPIGSAISWYADRQENRHSAKQQYTYNKWLQQANMEFQKEMAQNAHQYEIEDLKKAGLNPVLSANAPTAASIAGSSANQGTSPGGITTGAQQAFANALDTFRLKNETELNSASIGELNSRAAKNIQESKAVPQYLKNDTAKTNAIVNNMNLDAEYKNKTMNSRIAEQFARAEKEVAEGYISKDNAEFLTNYGITKQQALELGKVGLQELGSMIRKGVDALSIAKHAKELVKMKEKIKPIRKK